jgi:predicted P-loop ATPase
MNQEKDSPAGTKKSKLIAIEKFLEEKFALRYNVINGEVEIRSDGKEKYESVNENSLYRLLHHNGIIASIQEISILLGSDFVKRHNPIVNYFNRIQRLWIPEKHKDYIVSFGNYVKANNQERFNRHLKKWMVRSVVCALTPEYYNKTAFILVGEAQNTGKSSFIRFLCPSDLKDYMVENISTDKDSLIAICENFLINLDELATLSKLEINALKSIFSKDRVKVRQPYERKAKTMPRIANFIGSTNKLFFLSDETGSVRFLNFEISAIDWNYKKHFDVDILWSQAYHLWLNGFKYDLTYEEIEENEKINKLFLILTAEQELIEQYYNKGSSTDFDAFYSSTELLGKLYEKQKGVQLKLTNVVKALKILGFERVSKYDADQGQSRYGYFIKFN